MNNFSTLLFVIASLFSQKQEHRTLKKHAKIEARQIARLEANFVRLEKEMTYHDNLQKNMLNPQTISHNSTTEPCNNTSVSALLNKLNNPYIKIAAVAGISIYVWEKYKQNIKHQNSVKKINRYREIL